MKTKVLVCLVWVLCAARGMGGCYLDLYWPMNSGDCKYYTGPLGDCSVCFWQDWWDYGVFEMRESCNDSTTRYVIVGDELRNQGGEMEGYDVDFYPPLVELTEALLANGGSLTRTSEVEILGYEFPCKLTVKVTKAGAVTVPAGTYQNCLLVSMTVTITIPEEGTFKLSVQNYYLAPCVGIIKLAVYSVDASMNFKLVGWQVMTGGTVGGRDVRDLATLCRSLPPRITVQPKSTQVATNNGKALLTCQVALDASITYQWLKTGVPLQDGGAISGARTPILTLHPVSYSDQAYYSCVLSNAACQLATSSAYLRVLPDTNKPSVAITLPKNGASVSNALVTVQGTARDDIGLSGVQVRVGNGGFAEATTTNRWTNWTATVQVEPGPNAVQAQARDLEGNGSAVVTNTVRYVVCGNLVIQTNGVCPTPAPGLLRREINQPCRITAATYPGYRFLEWTGDFATNKPAITFVMRSDVALVANYLDIQRPTLTVTSAPSTVVSNAGLIMRGKAADNGCVARVRCRLNGGNWMQATGTTNWLAALEMEPGTNIVEVYCADTAGNNSPTNTVRSFFSVPGWLTLLTNGPGTITRSFKGDRLDVNRDYKVTARAGLGHVFSNWVGGYVSTNPTLTFRMTTNLVLQANFVTNPFTPVKGTYQGLFYPTAAPALTNSGYFTLNLTDAGAFSGRLLLAGATLSFSGGFNIERRSAVTVLRRGAAPLLLDLHLIPSEEGIDGWVADGVWVAPLVSDRTAPGSSNALAGKYTLVAEGAEDAENGPGGMGAGTLTVSPQGAVAVTATLGDGTAVSQATGISKEGQWPLYASLYKGQGVFMGWMGVNTNAEALWIKNPVAADKFYPAGFHEVRTVAISQYQPPAAGKSVLDWTNGQVVLHGGNWDIPLTNQVVLTNNQVRVLGGNVSNLTVTLTLPTGLFSGSFKHPATGASTPFKGALLQETYDAVPYSGGAWFRGTNQSGYVRLEVAPTP